MAIDLLTVTFDQAEAMIRLLTEIRDRLPAPTGTAPTPPNPPEMVAWGYVLGSGERPTGLQVYAARDFLERAERRGAWKVVEWDAAQEILAMAAQP